MLVRGADLTRSMSHYLIDQLDGIDNIEVHPYTEVCSLRGRRPPGAARRCATCGRPRPGRSTRPGCSSSSARSRTPTGSTAPSPGTATASSSPAPTWSRTASGRRGWTLPRDPYHLESSVPGVFAAGDVRADSVKRVASAVGEGAMAVSLVHRYLEAQYDARRNSQRLSPDELQTLFLFEKLDDEQLDCLCRAGRRRARSPAGTTVYRRGRPGDLLLRAARRRRRAAAAGSAATTSRPPAPSQRGVYGGATQAYIGDHARSSYPQQLHAITDVDALHRCPPTCSPTRCATGSRWRCTCWRASSSGCAASTDVTSERERLLALGSLSAGLTHELNNPAAAAVRATVGAAQPGRRHAAQARDDRRRPARRQPAAHAGRAAGGGGQAGGGGARS